MPALGTSRGLQIVSIVLCAVRFAALALMRRTRKLRLPLRPELRRHGFALLNATPVKQGDGFAQNAAHITGTFLGREN